MNRLKPSYIGLCILLTATIGYAFGLSIEDGNVIASDKFKPEMALNQYSNPDGKIVYQWQSQSETKTHPVIGYTQISDTKVRHIQRTKDRVIYDVIYTLDKYGRRVVLNKNPNSDKFMIFFGCSFTFGNGVNDDETVPYYAHQMKPEYTPYNYGIGAAGPHMMLAQTEELDFSKQIKENKGYIIYSHINSHVMRANGFMKEIVWLKDSPYYEKNEDGQLVYQGSFLEVQPWRTKLFLYLERTFKITKLLGRNFPIVRKVHYDYTCDLINQSKKNMLKIFPKAKFLLVKLPFTQIPKVLSSCLEKKGVKIVYTEYPMKDEYTIKDDGHFTAQGNRRFAESIVNNVKSESFSTSPASQNKRAETKKSSNKLQRMDN